MSAVLVSTGATTGLLAGVLLWWWLRDGSYRHVDDEPRADLSRTWTVVPAAGVAGGVAGAIPGWLAAAAWVYLVGGVAVTWIDLDVHRIPDRLLKAWTPTLGAFLLTAAVGERSLGSLVGAVAGAAVLGVLFLVLALVGSMGLGDVKLAAVTGLLLGAMGWASLTTGVFAGFLTAAAAGLWMLARGAGRTAHLAFGPALVVGAGVAILRLGAGA